MYDKYKLIIFYNWQHRGTEELAHLEMVGTIVHQLTKGASIEEIEKAGWDVGVAWQDGRMFHGPHHIRLNLALPLSRVKEAFDRMKKYVFVK